MSDWGLCKGGEVRSYPIGVPGVFLADPMMGVARKVEVQKKKASSKCPDKSGKMCSDTIQWQILIKCRVKASCMATVGCKNSTNVFEWPSREKRPQAGR